MEYVKVKNYVNEKLQRLDSNLTYHNSWHTMNDVLPAAERMAMYMAIEGNDLTLLKTAVLFHDIGYLNQYNKNEPVGAVMAMEALPEYSYSNSQIDIIKDLIMSTQMPQQPQTLLQEIICDADLDSLGRDDFYPLSMNLLAELNNYELQISKHDWHFKQLSFLQGHRYFTNAAADIRDKGKQKSIMYLKSVIDEP